jgi:ElaB/YqjD/DUF883 family membrane-anchored ribosome-binding protein
MMQPNEQFQEDENSKRMAVNDKAEYVGKMEHRLREIGANIDELMAKTGEAKSKATENLKLKHGKAMDSLHNLKTSSTEAWQEMKKGTELAWSELKQAFDEFKTGTGKAMSKFDKSSGH